METGLRYLKLWIMQLFEDLIALDISWSITLKCMKTGFEYLMKYAGIWRLALDIWWDIPGIYKLKLCLKMFYFCKTSIMTNLNV